ncbi:MAG TPA: acyl-CoA thioesterase [bacterium]|nr:acyl-CoA thioesterase [bacterium]
MTSDLPRPVSASRSEMVELVLPNDANPYGYIMGGRVMHLVDICGALAASRHAGGYVVTASIDNLFFKRPIRVGDLIVLKASVNLVHRTSMEVGVKIWGEEILTQRRFHTGSAYVTYVHMAGADFRPEEVPGLILETDEDRRRNAEAQERRRLRLALRESTEARRSGPEDPSLRPARGSAERPLDGTEFPNP